MRTVSSEIRKWQEEVLLRTRPNGEQKLSGRIAFAHESNMLEAVNLALNSFEEHWIDRDLQRTGLSLIVITAGTSFYQVDKALLRVTTERMLAHGVGLDIISLSKTPLHTVPLFSFRSHEPGLSDASLLTRNLALSATSSPPSEFPSDQRDPLYYDAPRAAQEQSTYYAEPLFVFCAFFGIQVDKPHRIDRFMPRARCYELSSQGIGERIPIALPLLLPASDAESEWTFLSEQEKRIARRDRYDANAVGAKAELGELGPWARASGVSELSTGSGSAGPGAMTEKAEPRPARPKDPPTPAPAPSLPPSPVQPSRRRAENRSVSTAIPVPERERGRERRLSDADQRRVPSLTPIGRRPRSPSIGAGSIRTVSSAHTNATRGTKSGGATPALIARLTANMAAPAATGTAAVAPASRPSWLGIFNRAAPAAPALAPSTVVQKVDARANVAPELDLDGSASSYRSPSISSTSSLSHTGTSSPSLGGTSATASRPTPTQPISISTRTAQTREADRPSTKAPAQAAPAPLSLTKKWARVVKGEPVNHPRLSGAKSGASLLNPSKPGKRSVGFADQARRWASIFIRHSNDQRAVNWVSVPATFFGGTPSADPVDGRRSITRGACLPMTTDYLPTAEDLASKYSDYRYSVPTSSTASSFLLRTDIAQRSPVLELMTELISQRLSHGFQICTPANALGALDAINLATSKTIVDVLRDMHLGETTAIYLSLASQIHRISYDRRTSAVVVKILRRRQTWAKDPYSYGALVWTAGASRYSHTPLQFPYPSMIDPVDWQLLDRLVAGDSKEDTAPALRYWRTRLVLLPAASVPDREYLVSKTTAFESTDVTDDDIQYQGFLTLMSLIQGLRWVPPGAEKDVTDVQTCAPSPSCPRLTAVLIFGHAARPSLLPSGRPRWAARRSSTPRTSPRTVGRAVPLRRNLRAGSVVWPARPRWRATSQSGTDPPRPAGPPSPPARRRRHLAQPCT